ncbi:MAG: MBG domain-containing protein [Pseudooceanicola sp.]
MAFPTKTGSAFRARSGSETALARGLILAAGLALAAPVQADPLPTGENVVSGDVGISRTDPQSMVIRQGSDRAVVNWQGFSIGRGAHVDVRQPGADSALLNRVTGDTTSEIHGRLTANGQVHLVNPNGIFIGPDGSVDAGGFVASTLGISDEDFLAGRLSYGGTGSSASVENAGRVTIGQGGYAALLGGRVRNSGVVTVPLGRIGFASGERVTLDLSGDQFLQVAVPTGGEDDGALIENSGTASAQGGLIEMRAATARQAVRHAVNLSGVAEARSVALRDGAIVLGGGAGGTVTVSGRASVAAVELSKRPVARPEVTITGRRIELAGAEIDASGPSGGGLIRIGGDFAGAGDLPRADELTVDAATVIRADATVAGQGGRIALWSEISTDFDGRLSARGGEAGGDGGFIEVSSKRTLAYGGLADTRAPQGKWGTLLLDPTDITIDPGTGGEDSLEASLELGNVVLSTSSADADPGDITINADIDWAAATELYLDADNNILLNGAINAQAGLLRIFAIGEILTNAASAIDVAEFALVLGDWSQVGALPAFSADDFSVASGANFLRATGGDGSFASPYGITDVYGLQGIGSSTLSGSSFILTNDIDASGTANWVNFSGLGFAPIFSFDGVLDGDGYTVSGLYARVDPEGLSNTAMFDTLSTDATVRDLRLTGAVIEGASAAVLAVTNSGVIENVRVDGTVYSEGPGGGGLVAFNDGTINDSVADVDVTLATLSGATTYYAGGFVGLNGGTINRSNAQGDVDVTNAQVDAVINAGGFAGREGIPFSPAGQTINDSHAHGNVTVDSTGGPDVVIYAGGFVGVVAGSVNQSYSTGGAGVTGDGTSFVGGFAAEDFSSGLAIGNFWDTDTSGLATSAAGTGLTTAEFQDTETFIELGEAEGWDFASAWAPGDVGFHPVNYTTAPVILATPDALSVQYGLTDSATTTGTTAGGPGSYVFDEDGDAIDPADLAAIFESLTFASTDAGTTTFTLDTAAVNSTDGVTYRVIDRVGDATITLAPLTITADDLAKTYGEAVVPTGFTTGTLYFSDSVDSVVLASEGAAAAAPVDGSPYSIAVSGATGTGLSNYDITYVAGALTVNPAALTVTADDGAKTYGEVFAPTGFSTSGLLFSDSVDSVTLSSGGEAPSAPVSGSPYSIDVSGATGTGLSNYTITYVPGTLIVSPASLTITADDGAKTYGETFTPTGYQVSGLFDFDSVDSVTLASAGSAAGASVAGSPYAITASDAAGTGLENYTIAYVPGSLVVSPAALVITASDATKVYGEAFTPTGFSTSGLLLTDSVDSVTLASAGSDAAAPVGGSPYVIAASDAAGTGLENYSISYVDGALTVTPAPLTITADDQMKVFGETFTFDGDEFTTSGLVVAGDSVDSATLDSAGADPEASVAESPYAISIANPTGTGLENYDITLVGGSMTVTPSGEDPSPRPPVIGVPGLPNPPDSVDTSVVTIGGGSGGIAGERSRAAETLEVVQNIADSLEAKADACGQGDSDVTRYLACMSDALNDFANELDDISGDLPPALQNVARIVQDARAGMDRARARATQRLATATTEAERRAITNDALNEARAALDTASGEIRKAIALVRVEDPELASLQRATITTVADSIDSVGIKLSRVADL